MPGSDPLAVSAVITCKGRLDHLKETLPLTVANPFAEVVVVDYDCPQGTADWVSAHFPAVKVVKVVGQPLYSPAASRNIGARASSSPWILFLDADVRLAPNFLEDSLPRLKPGAHFRAKPRNVETWGTFFVMRADYDAMGGYDEVFRNWSGEDSDLLERLTLAGVGEEFFDGSLIDAIAHSDEMRVRFHKGADAGLSGFQNSLYRIVKRDLARQGVNLSPEARAKVFEAILSTATPQGISPAFEVTFAREVQFEVEITAQLKYNLRLVAPKPARVVYND